jgi:catechol 2,3-dioxygenase-like lactoylglutathione lyase family enzyme
MAKAKSRAAKRTGHKRPRTAAAPRGTGKKTAVRRSAAASSPKRRRAPETLRLRSVQPSFTVDDLQRSLRFYTDVLGFVVGERWEDGGQLRGVMLKAGACELGLSQDDWAKGRDRKKGEGMSLWCSTAQDVDALAARIKAAGSRLAEEPRDQSWGGRSLSVDDPDGFRLRIYEER